MRVLLLKTSSLGDVIHTLPALSDAREQIPDLQIDWVVEESITEIPTWHPAVRQVIPVALRRWRKHPFHYWNEWRDFRRHLRTDAYDLVLDAQGLLKSALLSLYCRGVRAGFNRSSCREPLAAWCYQRRYDVPWQQHAVQRLRQLFAQAFDYPCPDTPPNYGIAEQFNVIHSLHPTFVFLHGTTWKTKHWPVSYWQALAKVATDAGYNVQLPWGNAAEHERAETIAAVDEYVKILPRLDLKGIATTLLQAKMVIGVDTGLAHLAAALNLPTVTLYGSTCPDWTGTYGVNQIHLQAKFPCAPCLNKQCHYHGKHEVFPACYSDLSVERVWMTVQMQL